MAAAISEVIIRVDTYDDFEISLFHPLPGMSVHKKALLH